MSDAHSAGRHEPARALATALLARLPQLTDVMVDRILSNVDSYRSGVLVKRDDLYESCLANLEFMLRHIAHEQPVNLDAPRATGVRRAQQRVPLAVVQHAFRVSFQYLWEVLIDEAQKTQLASAPDLVAMASDVWTFHDVFSRSMMNAYAETMEEIVVRREHERSALVESLFRDDSADTTLLWEAAHLLDLPYEGAFVVVAAAVQKLARTALPEIESALRRADYGSAWRLTPDVHIGVVSVRDENNLSGLMEILNKRAVGAVGVSPVYARLDQTPHALRFARIAMANTESGTDKVTQFDDAPLPMVILSAPITARRLSRKVLGALLDQPADDRDALISTLITFFESDASVNAAGDRLTVHPNTVRYRLRRIEQLTGRSLQRPPEAAELYVAIQAWQKLPRSAEDPIPPARDTAGPRGGPEHAP